MAEIISNESISENISKIALAAWQYRKSSAWHGGEKHDGVNRNNGINGVINE
jgi:hypothetical protein